VGEERRRRDGGKSLRILVLSNKCPPDYDGGYELSAFQVAGALRDRGYDVTLLTSHYRDSYNGSKGAEPDWVKRKLTFVEWPKLTGSNISRMRQDFARVSVHTSIGARNADVVKDFLENNSFDLAYCFGLQGIGLAAAYPFAESKVPILWHAGNYLIAQDLQLNQWLGRQRLAHRLAVRFSAKRAYQMVLKGDYSHIAFLSEAMKKVFVGMGYEPPHSYIIPRGIDFPLTEDVDRPRPPVFLMASRIGSEKGYDVVMQACGLLAKQSTDNWSLRIAGSGDETYIQSLKDKAKSLGIQDRIHFLGMLKREEVLDEMRNAYAFISASLWEEPFGRTNIESLACGAALIAADTGAIREIVADSKCAEIYEKTNAQQLAAIMDDLLRNQTKRAELARRGVQRIKDAYTMDRILDLTENVFAQVMKDYGKPFAKPRSNEN